MLKLQFVIEAVDKATGKLAAVNRAVDASVDRITAPARKLRAAINGLVKESGVERVQAAWGNLKDKIAAMPMVAAISMGGAFAIMHRTIEETDRMVDASRKLNVPVAQFQRLGFAASVNGSSMEEMAGSLQFLSQNMVEAISGGKEMQLWFSRVGLSVAQLRKMNAVQVFEAIADRFQRVGDAGGNAEKKIALTRALMGRGGAEQVQMLNQGSAALRKAYEEADKYGVINEATAEGFKESADNIKRFEFSLRGLFATITAAALPGLDALLKKVAGMNAQNRVELGEKIGKMLGAFIEKMPKVLQSLGQISKAVVMLVGVLDSLAQAFGGWDTLIVAFSTLMVAKGVWGVFELVKALGILSGALVMTPAGWFLLAVTGIATAAYLVYKNWLPIKAFFSDLWDGVLKRAQAVGDWLRKWLPAWAVPGMGSASGLAGPAAAPMAMGAPTPSMLTNGAARAGMGTSPIRPELGGTLKIEIDANGQPRVREMRKAPGGLLDFDVYNGPSLVN